MWIQIVLALICFECAVHSIKIIQSDSPCRFASKYSKEDIFNNNSISDQFIRQIIKWQSKFINEVGVDKKTGLTYDGSRLDVQSGELLPKGLHQFTAASKESIHLGILAQVLNGAKFSEEIYEVKNVFKIIEQKILTLEAFYQKYPGFGGYLPWVYVNGTLPSPTYDFINRVPALDNAQMFWGALSLSIAWQQKYPNIFPQLKARWDTITWKSMIKNARKMFYNETTGKIRAVATILDMYKSVDQNQYTNNDNYYLDDPYEGELYMWIIQLFGKDSFTRNQLDRIWEDKRNKLQSTEFKVKTLENTSITVQRGCWFSAHEQWKNLFMPYTLSQTYKRIALNNEKARVWNSIDLQIPGMFASVSGPASTNEQDTGYFSDSGIESIAFNKVTFNKIVTPYSTYPLLLVYKEYGLVWLHNMLISPAAQTKYGSLEGTGLNGTLISPMMTWDTKITTVLALLNGTKDIIERYLKKQGLLEKFVGKVQQQYARVFSDIKGQNIPLHFPLKTILQGRPDFTSCS